MKGKIPEIAGSHVSCRVLQVITQESRFNFYAFEVLFLKTGTYALFFFWFRLVLSIVYKMKGMQFLRSLGHTFSPQLATHMQCISLKRCWIMVCSRIYMCLQTTVPIFLSIFLLDEIGIVAYYPLSFSTPLQPQRNNQRVLFLLSMGMLLLFYDIWLVQLV